MNEPKPAMISSLVGASQLLFAEETLTPRQDHSFEAIVHGRIKYSTLSDELLICIRGYVHSSHIEEAIPRTKGHKGDSRKPPKLSFELKNNIRAWGR